jgi:hypothetical protein
MATLSSTSPIPKRTEFEALVSRWETRRRLQKLVLWLPRIVAVALSAGIAVLLFLNITGLLAGTRILMAAGIVMSAMIIIGIFAALRSRPIMDSVRQFDLEFDLQERVSTALELLGGRIQTGEELAAYQLEDAYSVAKQIDPKAKLKLVVRPAEWAAVVGLIVLFLLAIWATGVLAENPNDLSAATTQAIDEATDELRAITEDVATETALTPEERQALLETLETSLDNLEDVPLSAEEAFAAVTEVGQQLREQSAAMRDALQAQQDAYNAAAEQLQNAESQNGAAGGDTPGLATALEDMLSQLEAGAMNDSMAEAMQNAANELAAIDPALAQSLQNAASGLQNANTSMSQEALQEALDQLQQNQTEAQNRADATESLENAAENAQSAAQNIASAEQEQQQGEPNASEDSSSGETREGAPQDDAQTGAGESESPNNQAGAAGEDQQNPGGNDSGGQSDSGNPQLSNQGSAAVPGDSPNPGETGENTAGNSGTAAGAGDSQGAASSNAGGGADQNNNPDGMGESQYESVYAPDGLDAAGSANVVLEPDSSEMPVVEGNFQDNPTGAARVPYNQVFRQYADAVSRALSNDYIPLSLRDVVQDYFTSLEPEQE